MALIENVASPTASLEEILQGWNGLTLRVSQLEAERSALEQENKTLRFLLERVIEHRQKSHGELILLLTGLVSKLPINDVGLMVSKLVEHNSQVAEVCAALAKGRADTDLPQPAVLKALVQTKRDLVAAVKPLVEELIQLDTSLESDMLRSLITQPDLFFSPPVIRANRCFAKGQVARERIVRDFGEAALMFFNDMTTDPKLNPRPKPEEIVLGFKEDFEAWFQGNPGLIPDKREELLALYQRVQRGKTQTEQARAQRRVFQKLSFVLELIHYYENQSTEPPDVVFAQRLPALVEQLVVANPQEKLEEKAILEAQSLLAFIINPDHRLMAINNMGKGGGVWRTLRFVLRLRAEKTPDQDEVIPEFIKHLIPAPPQPPPSAQTLAASVRLIKPELYGRVMRSIMSSERIRRDQSEALGRAVGKELGLTGLGEDIKIQMAIPPEMETEMAWKKVRELIAQRGDPAAIAAAFRERLHAKYDADELKQSWMTLVEADTMSLIRTFCQLPYLSDGTTDSLARTVMETYVTRLTHEKYAATYTKVANSLRNMYQANQNSPTLVNFLALVRWVDPDAANKLANDIGMPIQ